MLANWGATSLVAAVALFTVLTVRLSPISVLAVYGASAFLLVMRFRRFRLTPPNVFIVIFLSYLLLSSMWSIYPDVTLRAALQSASTVGCAWIVAKCTDDFEWSIGLIVGIGLALAGAVASGDLQPTEDAARLSIGLLGSKNQLGLVASVMFLSSVFLVGRRNMLTFALLAALFSGTVLMLSTSAGAIVMTLGALLTLLVIRAVSLLELRLRIAVLTTAMTLMVVALIFLTGDLLDAVLAATGRDQTLTGRTDLWQYGLDLWHERQLLGHGFSAFWTQGNPDAELIWAEFYIPSRTGFHFHSLYVEYLVGVGLVGTLMLVLILIYAVTRIIVLSLSGRLVFGQRLAVAICAMILIRSFFEVELFAAYHLSTICFIGALDKVGKQNISHPSAATS